MYEVLLWQPKLLLTIFIFTVKKIFWKNSQKSFLFYQKSSSCSQNFQVFYFPLSLFFSFLAIADFIEEVEWW